MALVASEHDPQSHLMWPLELMAQHNETLVTPAAWAGPDVPNPPQPDQLSCRADIHKWPRPDNQTDDRFKFLPPLPPNMTTCGRLNFSTPTAGGAWFRDERGAPEFTLPSCRLRDLRADEGLTCLKGRHIAWIGDSTMRYQVLYLVYWLMYDAHPDPDNRLDPGEQGLDKQGNEAGWDAFFVNLTTVLNPTTAGGGGCVNTTCPNCVHSYVGGERWHFRFALASGAPVHLSLTLVRSAHPQHTVDALQQALNASSPGYEHPDLLFLNMGIWLMMGGGGHQSRMPLTFFLHKYELVFQQARRLVNAQVPDASKKKTRLVFRATTYMAGQAETADGLTHNAAQDYKEWDQAWPTVQPLVRQLALWFGIDYFDVDTPGRIGFAAGLPRLDQYHQRASFNEMYNELLMNILC